MASASRLLFAALIAGASACGLIYDVDSITNDDTCGKNGLPCCASEKCGDYLLCVAEEKDAGTDAGCECPATDAAGTDTQTAPSCDCESKICKPCGGPLQACCEGQKCAGTTATCGADSICTGCGVFDGDPCCEDDNGNELCAFGLKCENDQCKAACGAQAQACCAGACNDGLTCQSETCQPPPVGECGGQGQPCCTSGPSCDQTNLKCDGTNCIACGGEGQPCCDSPLCSAPSLTCDGGGICRTCPWVGAPCSGGVCVGVGDGSQCAGCGALGQNCCSSTTQEPCPNQLYCCQGTAPDGCNGCTSLPCLCKVCCVRCVNWASGSYVKVPALPGGCDNAGIAECNGKGGKAFAQFRTSCPP